MVLLLLSFVILLVSAALSLCFRRSPARASAAGVYGAVAASVAGLVSAGRILLSGGTETLSLPWPVPLGSLSFNLDPLAAFFLVPVFLLTAFAAIYGSDYLKSYAGKKPLALAWAAFNLLTAAMVLVITSANAVLFMLGWELMAAASFLLVVFEHEKAQVRKAAFLYLVVGAAGALFLLLLFSLLSPSSPSFDFSTFRRPEGVLAAAAFLAALAGFGLKAGFIPFHVWLPEAHPAAPSHVSAVMSGVMIKLGIYGIMRMLSFLAPWPAWWGWTLVFIGAVSGLLGVLFALSQHDLKRMLAYSSIENVGIIILGLGLAVVGTSHGMYPLAALAFGGALLHVLNHALFKGLLFMGAGAVLHSTGTTELEALGGLAKKMPQTAFYFLVGSAAISGLPPFNGLVSEFLIYLGSFGALRAREASTVYAAALAIGSLSAIGALALACFSKAFGTCFLGEPRSANAAGAHEAGQAMRAAMAALAWACCFIGLASPLLVAPLAAAAGCVLDPRAASELLRYAPLPLSYLSAAAAAFLGAALAVALLRAFALRGRVPAAGPTWDCGYAAPTAKMQYGASSFAQPLTDFFQPALRAARHYAGIAGYFPGKTSFHTENKALFYDNFYTPAAAYIRRLAFRFSWLQQGRLQFYILYIVTALIALLIWKL
ncbi:MAG TPA: hypothetical protein DCZ92_12775 [Elusimicrobia bacterium]|nr:MAG: hypothetical protein A2016_07560 [Elusimicrobia bacterium GWF2_62_30]HBA61662.1 hypothetical protein [Elusimicrobiota bacterium]